MRKKSQINFRIAVWFLSVFFLFGFHRIINAQECCSPRNADPSPFCLTVEYAYFQPLFNNDFIANPNEDPALPFNLQPGGPGHKNNFDYTSGYRINALYRIDNCLFSESGLRFTHLPTTHQNKRINFSSSPLFSNSLSNHRLTYYAADLYGTIPVFEICRLSLFVQPGLHYAFMDFKSRLQFSNLNQFLSEKSQTWGAGPELGFNLIYKFCDCLSIKGNFLGGLLISRAKARFSMENIGLNSHSRPLVKVFPFWETRLSLCYSICLKKYQIDMELGYEYLSYPNYIDRIQYPSNGSTVVDNVFSNFDFQGPFVSVSLNF